MGTGRMDLGRLAGRSSVGTVGRRFLKWNPEVTKGLGQQQAENWDRMKRTRPLLLVNRKLIDTQHNNDMYRIAGGGLGPGGFFGKSSRESGTRVKPRISFVKDPVTGKIVPERKARTFQKSNVPWRPELPVGKPTADMPPMSVRGSGGRMAANPAYAAWKGERLEYNSALSRQQQLQPNNPVIQTIQPVKENTTSRYPGVPTRYYVPRGGGQNMTLGPVKNPATGKTNPFMQVA